MSTDWVSDIHEMHRKFGFHENLEFNAEFLKFRIDFIKEELKELDTAILGNDADAAVDALIDMAVVIIGTLDCAEVDSHKAWDEVHTKNMSKIRANNPTRKGSGGFDLIKPMDWVPPSHAENVGLLATAVYQAYANSLITDKPGIPSHIAIMDEWREFAMAKDFAYNDKEDPDEFHFTYYPDGIRDTIYEILKKVKRFKNTLKKIMNGSSEPTVIEGHNDSLRDIGIYAAISEAIRRGKLEGQEGRDIFNRKK